MTERTGPQGRLAGKAALVTGGTRGIGRAISLALAREGARVFVNYRSDDARAERTAAEVAEVSGFGRSLRADVSDAGEVEALVGAVLEEAGGLHILVNNAGMVRDGLLMMMPEDNWRQVIDVNLNGTFHCSKAALRPMVESRWGRIINLTSPSAIMGRKGQCNYSASKGGIMSLTRSLARETGRLGITVNAISPGVIETELTGAMGEKLRRELLSMIPLGRFGSAEEVASAAVFLASDESWYITGQTISLDGGLT